ncbi:MAG TPA: response regulator [Roseiflexaceae bacterium]
MATILVVDDEAPIVDLLVDIVEERGHTALRANNGAEALSIAHSARPDLIISDVMMPALDGYALLGALRTAPELAKISIILMSAAFPQRGIPPAHPAADGYLRKPFDINSVEAILDRLATQEYGH